MKRFCQSVLAIALAGSVLVPMTASALDIPKHSARDHRIRYVNYDPDDVIQLDVVVGVASHIQLEEGETFVYHAFGDAAAYEFTVKLNHLFLKPKADDADSNLLVITNRRTYAFRISYSSDRTSQALYKLAMRYPDTEASLTAQEANQAVVQSALSKVGAPVNWQSYTKSGDIGISPIHAWDDGKQTWLQFAQQADLPAIYMVDRDGQEVMTNFHIVDKRTVVLHRTAAKWHLRIGNQVAAIHNGRYLQVPIGQDTGTASSAVKRVVIGAEPEVVPVAVPDVRLVETIHITLDTPAAVDPVDTSPISVPEELTQAMDVEQTSTAVKVVEALQLEPVVESGPLPPTEPEPAKSPTPAPLIVGQFFAGEGNINLMPKAIKVAEEKTSFSFSSDDMPSIRVIDESNNEQFVDLHIESANTLVVHTTSSTWRLRRGDDALILHRNVMP